MVLTSVRARARVLILVAIAAAIVFAACKSSLVDAVNTIRGEAMSPRIALTTAASAQVSANGTVSFPDTATGNRSDLVLTIANSGKTDLMIGTNGVSLTMNSGTEADSFSLLSQPTTIIPAGQSAMLPLRFSPSSLGDKSAIVTIPTNDVDAPSFSFTIMGICVPGNKDITAFGFESPAVTGLISGTAIDVNVPLGTNISLLVATFATTGVSVTANSVAQTSGATTVDFSHGSVDYIVKAADATTRTYTVTVTLVVMAPILSATPVLSAITWTTASGAGAVASDGGATIPAGSRGICWNTSGSPTIADSKQADVGGGAGSFTCSLSGLLPGTYYYVRAYATNSAGTGYGGSNTFTTTPATPPTTTIISNINAVTAVSGGTAVADSGVTISACGVCWNTGGSPTIAAPDSKTVDGSGAGTFTSSMTGLTYATTYHVRAYATNQGGTVYGNEQTLKTVGYLASDGVGIVFYDQGSIIGGWRYLEAAPEDQSPGIVWWGTWTPGTSQGVYDGISTSATVGTGKSNTAAIGTKPSPGSYAATYCTTYAGGGNSDWFLPSKDELHLMYVNLKTPSISAFNDTTAYWSSTTYTSLSAYGNVYAEYFQSTSYQSVFRTNSVYCVRAARRY